MHFQQVHMRCSEAIFPYQIRLVYNVIYLLQTTRQRVSHVYNRIYMYILLQGNKNLKIDVDVGMKKAQKQGIIQNVRRFGVFYPFLHSTQQHMQLHHTSKYMQLHVHVLLCGMQEWVENSESPCILNDPLFLCFFIPTSTSIFKFLFPCFCLVFFGSMHPNKVQSFM